MKAMTALIRREFLEHRGAFLYAPAVLVGLLTLFITLGMVFGHTPTFTAHSVSQSPTSLIQVGFGGIVGLWSVYLLIVLYFYYADAFSADTRNNSMLFWKSMPQSDIKILTSKALAGVTIFPALILGFALITMVLAYLLSFPLAARLPFIPIANPVDVVISMFTIGVSAVVLFILTILWYAPFLALVAGLSTLVKRWAIPAAVLFIGALILAEGILTFGSAGRLPSDKGLHLLPGRELRRWCGSDANSRQWRPFRAIPDPGRNHRPHRLGTDGRRRSVRDSGRLPCQRVSAAAASTANI